MDPKRDSQWLVDNTNQEHQQNKRQAIESSINRSVFGAFDASLWPASANRQPLPGPVNVPLFGTLLTPGNPHMETFNFNCQYPLNSSSMGFSNDDHSKRLKPTEIRDSNINEHTFLAQSDALSFPNPNEKNFLPIGNPLQKQDNTTRGLSNFFETPIVSSLRQEPENIIPMRFGDGKPTNDFISFTQTYRKADDNKKRHANVLPMGSICFDRSDKKDTPSSSKVPDSAPNSTAQLGQNPAGSSGIPAVPAKGKDSKAAKRTSSNNFPTNVKSLLSTGMLDGVPVKYVSWSREKSLVGAIQGTGYLCSCKECNFTKSLNAYEFERHANCKTKHPNNHIYFENGKTIYGVVQELKNTPQDMLFDTIQNVTGSTINMRNFNIWKASYQAATRELQRIYGKDDAVAPP